MDAGEKLKKASKEKSAEEEKDNQPSGIKRKVSFDNSSSNSDDQLSDSI